MNKNRAVRWLVCSVLMIAFSAAAFAQIGVGISVRFGPPAIPIYAQPICPGPGYFWTPGYWAWNDGYGYYWVPGTWVVAPVGMLWTPGYWGWYGGYYRWRPGYWGRHVGFYGGINYGYGYGGYGFWGGEWRGERFYYNRSVTNINVVNVTNVYERRVEIRNNSRVSYNGGSGGIGARPTPEEERWEHEPHREALADQQQHERVASQNRRLFASENHGRPEIAATSRPGEFGGRDVVRARAAGESYHAPKMSPRDARVSENEARGAEGRNMENNRDARSEKRNEGNRGWSAPQGSRNNDRMRARDEQRQQKEQGKQEQKYRQQEVKRQQHEQQMQQKQAQQEQKRQQQEQKRQRQEQKHGGQDRHNPGF